MGSEARATGRGECAVSELADLARRVDRVESQLAIQQLAARYALAVDSRDLDTWVDLFVEDVDCGSYGKGREALKKFIEVSNQHTPYLLRKAQRIEEYLNQH